MNQIKERAVGWLKWAGENIGPILSELRESMKKGEIIGWLCFQIFLPVTMMLVPLLIYILFFSDRLPHLLLICFVSIGVITYLIASKYQQIRVALISYAIYIPVLSAGTTSWGTCILRIRGEEFTLWQEYLFHVLSNMIPLAGFVIALALRAAYYRFCRGNGVVGCTS